jgi:hypothetical protein
MIHRRPRTPGRRRLALATVAAVGLALGATGLPSAVATSPAPPSAPPSRPHHPAPSHFTRGRVTNPWFPLRPGTRYAYRGVEGTAHTRDVMIATYRTRTIDGVVCRVVFDRVWRNGRLDERTRDFYAQTRSGTVWYFGERTATLDRHGHVKSREGSFMSGINGAEAGVFMTAHPRVGPSYYQEYYTGHAQDIFTVVRRGARVAVPLFGSHHALLTRETTPLEPGVVDHKYYLRDVGSVREQTVKGGRERLWLVGLTHIPHP